MVHVHHESFNNRVYIGFRVVQCNRQIKKITPFTPLVQGAELSAEKLMQTRKATPAPVAGDGLILSRA